MKKISIIIIIISIILMITLILKKIYSKPRVAILIISAKGNRWNYEKTIWNKYKDKYSNIKCFFIQCQDNNSDDYINTDTLSFNCKESYKPGIYQKSLHALKDVGDDYDFYIRGNLSTFFIFEYLNAYLQKIPRDKPVITGGGAGSMISAKTKKEFVSGTSIVLNKLARDKLIQYGFNKEYYEDKYTCDDVLMAYVLLLNEPYIKVSKNEIDPLYWWKFNKSYDFNLKNIENKKYPFLRLKTKDTTKYKEITQNLINKYYI